MAGQAGRVGLSTAWPATGWQARENAARLATRSRVASSLAGRASAAKTAASSACCCSWPRRIQVPPMSTTKAHTTSSVAATSPEISATAPRSSLTETSPSHHRVITGPSAA